MQSEKEEFVAKSEAQHRPKKPYATPKLTVHGNVKKITEGFGGQDIDGLLGSSMLRRRPPRRRRRRQMRF